jgi:prefoldin subunit 5
MQLPRIPETVEKHAKTVIKEVNDNIKKLDGRLGDIQQRVRGFATPERLDEFKTKFSNESKELTDKTVTWLEETYSSTLDRLGVATKDEVEVLRKKLSTLQRRVTELKKALTHKAD